MENVKYMNLFNIYHLGDHIFNIIYFIKIENYILEKNIVFVYYCLPQYHSEIKHFIPLSLKSHIIIKNIHDYENEYRRRLNHGNNQQFQHLGLEAWINNTMIIPDYYLQCSVGFDTYYTIYYNCLSKKLQIPKIIMDLSYSDEDLLVRYSSFQSRYPDLFSSPFDILFINSVPKSGQLKYDKNQWNQFILFCHQKNYKVITTLKCGQIPCTMDLQFSCKDIAALSTHVRFIVAVNTGPFVGCYNDYTLQNVEKIFIFVNNLYFNHPKIHQHINIEDLYPIFSS